MSFAVNVFLFCGRVRRGLAAYEFGAFAQHVKVFLFGARLVNDALFASEVVAQFGGREILFAILKFRQAGQLFARIGKRFCAARDQKISQI